MLCGGFVMEKTELQIEWKRRIDAFKASGMPQAKWCAMNDLKVHQLKYWLKKIGDSNPNERPKTKWTSISFEETTEKDSSESLFIKISEASIEVKPGFNPSFLTDVIKVLKTVC